MRGLLFVVAGPMFAGKTSVIIDAIQTKIFLWKGMEIECNFPTIYCHSRDAERRGATPSLTSHNETKVVERVSWLDEEKIHNLLKTEFKDYDNHIDWIFIDELQFFDKEGQIKEFVETLLSSGINVCLAGLAQDSFGEPFGAMGHFLAVADYVNVIQAQCSLCNRYATRTQRLTDSEEQILVAAEDDFAPRCHICWSKIPEGKS